MARAYTKCSECENIMWFRDQDVVPQIVICPCHKTKLTEEGPEGEYEDLTQEEIDAIPEG